MDNVRDDIKDTPEWNSASDPDYDITIISPKGFLIKVKNHYIRENDNCTVLLYDDSILVKATITDGRIDEYESLPGRMGEQFGAKNATKHTQNCHAQNNHEQNNHEQNDYEQKDYEQKDHTQSCEMEESIPVAWLYINNKNKKMRCKQVQEVSVC